MITANNDIANLTKNDVVIICGGANDAVKQLHNGLEARYKLYYIK